MPSIVDRLNINITKRQILESIKQAKEEKVHEYRFCDRCYIGKLLDILNKGQPFIISCIDIKECLNHQYGMSYDTKNLFCTLPYPSDNILSKLQHRTIHI